MYEVVLECVGMWTTADSYLFKGSWCPVAIMLGHCLLFSNDIHLYGQVDAQWLYVYGWLHQ